MIMVCFFDSINKYVWGIPVLILIFATGIYFTVHTKFAQLRLLPSAIKLLFSSLHTKEESEENTAFRALCTALAATVGTGNLAGVAGAIAIGGPGAIFWIWVSGVLGMVIKFAEVTLSVKHRIRDSSGQWVGGPMVTIANSMPEKFHCLAYIYCFFGIIASFGVGNATQVNAVIGSLEMVISQVTCATPKFWNLIVGIVLAAIIFAAFQKRGANIGQWTQILIPFAAGAYIVLSLLAVIKNFNRIPYVCVQIISGAFQPGGLTGGLIVSAYQVMRIGISRGIFTNESGMGTASIAHAKTTYTDPIKQGLLGISEVFIDTILICSLTAFVILTSDISIPYGTDSGILLTMDAFSSVYGPWICYPLMAIVCLFAVATILGWGSYGLDLFQFLFGNSCWRSYLFMQIFVVLFSVIAKTPLVWTLSEILNGLMAIPNLIMLLYFSREFIQMTKAYRYV